VYSTSTLSAGNSTSTPSNGSPPSPSGGPAGTSRKLTAPSGVTRAGTGWPARASEHRRETGSYTAYTQVAYTSRVASLPATPSVSADIRFTRSSRRVSSSSGGTSTSASVRTAARSLPMVADAWMSCPTTSPITKATRAPDSGMTSNQSPPTPAWPVAGRYRLATSTADCRGSRCGSKNRCNATAVPRSRLYRRALSSDTAARPVSSSASSTSSSPKGSWRCSR
jgi:hypothetical protein